MFLESHKILRRQKTLQQHGPVTSQLDRHVDKRWLYTVFILMNSPLTLSAIWTKKVTLTDNVSGNQTIGYRHIVIFFGNRPLTTC